MQQNKYDDPEFFTRYSSMSRSVEGLSAAGEWYVLREMLPDVYDKRVLDLGCGFGWHCRYAREQHARHVLGMDLSERMLARAREMTDDSAIEYRQMAIEDIAFPADSFDVVLSSLAFHYVARLDTVFAKVFDCLVRGGTFVFSMEHPLFTARDAQDWHYGPQGERLHWPVDDYQSEGIRHSRWMTDDIVKYHRTIATILNTVLAAGFQITRIEEPPPHPDAIAQHEGVKDENRRPMFLLVAAIKP
jgi:SAM-dependent methyltransferase